MGASVVFEAVMGQGIFAALFIWLFFTYQREVRKRDEEFINLIKQQSELLRVVSAVLDKTEVNKGE